MAHKSVRSFLQLAGTNVVTKACWALVLLLLLRQLGAASFGVLATLWSGAAIAAGFSDCGTNQALLREGSRNHGLARQLAMHSLRVQATVTIAAIVLLAAAFWVVLPADGMQPWQRGWIIALGVATPLIDRFQALFTACSQIGGNYAVYSRLRSSYFVVLLLVILGVLWAGGGMLAVSVTYFSLTTFFAALMGAGTWALLPAPSTDRVAEPTSSLVWLGIPFLLVTTLALAYGRIEVTILGLFGRTALAGSYHVIYQLVLLVYSVAGMFFTVTYPRLYRHLGNDNALLADFRDTARWLSLLGWIAAPPLWLFAQPILNLMGGTGLTAYAPLLQVLAVMVLIIPASAALNFLLPADMLRVRVGCDATGIAITAGIAAWAAANDRPVWVAAGAVIGYSAAMILSQVALQRKLRGVTHILLQEFAQIGARILPGAALVWWMPGDWWQKLFAFAATGAAFLFTYRPIAQRLRFWIRSAPRE